MSSSRLEAALAEALADLEAGSPPRLAAAIDHAVFPGGGRVRPRLSLAVAQACGAEPEGPALGAACAIELLHCASLVHDDLPCFDDADLRRGRPSVHRAYGEPLALLAGDALIVLAFETVARAASSTPERVAPLVALIARATGANGGIVAGQGWESEPSVSLERYHAAKTGSLFVAATMGGAIAAGADPLPWRAMGECLGQAYQVADDLLDACAAPGSADKPLGRDAALQRPSAATQRAAAIARLHELAAQAADAVPECPGAPALRALVRQMAIRLLPASLQQSAA